MFEADPVDRLAITPVLPSTDWLEAPPPPIILLVVAPPDTPPQPSPARVILHVLIALFTFFLIVRTIALEPFGVPTGSMAAAFYGNHREDECHRCGYRVVVGEPGPDARPVRFEARKCPNCGAPIDLSKAREIPGDRLLVDKTAFLPRPPRRWEIAVFHCPADDTKPYVKRVVGMPGELVHIFDGDVYANGELQRKTLAQVRALKLAVFDMNYAPQPGGWGVRWLDQPVADPKLPTPPRGRTPDLPVKEEALRENALFLDATARPLGIGLTYRHFDIDAQREEPVGDWLTYNGGPAARRDKFARKQPDAASEPVHDFLVEFDLEVIAGEGTFACRLGDGADTVRAELPLDPNRDLALYHDGGSATQKAAGFHLQASKTYRVEFAFVDRRASLAIDGVEVIAPLDLPAPPANQPRKGVSRPLQLGVRGGNVVVRNLKIDRDIHYTIIPKTPRNWQMGADEYFLLGDNTSNSHDSRVWEVDRILTPGVRERDFIGKPFLIHQPLKLSHTTVNGKDREVQTLDWSRLQWLR